MRSATAGLLCQVGSLLDYPVVHGLCRRLVVPDQLIEGFPVHEDLVALVLADRLTRNRRRRRHEDGLTAVSHRVPQVGHVLQDRPGYRIEQPTLLDFAVGVAQRHLLLVLVLGLRPPVVDPQDRDGQPLQLQRGPDAVEPDVLVAGGGEAEPYDEPVVDGLLEGLQRGGRAVGVSSGSLIGCFLLSIGSPG